MRPFAVATLTRKRLTRNEVDTLVQQAVPVFEEAYLGQWRRIVNAINRASPRTQAQFDAAIRAFLRGEGDDSEPELVQRSVQGWYNRNFVEIGRDTFRDTGLDEIEWSDINDSLLETSRARAGWFSRAMTETSVEQTQDKIAKWLDTEGGTIGELQADMKSIWTGPRPDVAALTETTNLATQSQVTVGKAAGYWGYNVRTRNDSSVRPEHKQIADDGPYPFSDTEHMPPLDYNCRCFITFVREEPA